MTGGQWIGSPSWQSGASCQGASCNPQGASGDQSASAPDPVGLFRADSVDSVDDRALPGTAWPGDPGAAHGRHPIQVEGSREEAPGVRPAILEPMGTRWYRHVQAYYTPWFYFGGWGFRSDSQTSSASPSGPSLDRADSGRRSTGRPNRLGLVDSVSQEWLPPC